MTDDTHELVHIGEVAERTGLSHRTIRYDEGMGTVEPVDRTEGGFRLYDEAATERLPLIMPMRPLGFSIQQIREAEAFARRLGRVQPAPSRRPHPHHRNEEIR